MKSLKILILFVAILVMFSSFSLTAKSGIDYDALDGGKKIQRGKTEINKKQLKKRERKQENKDIEITDQKKTQTKRQDKVRKQLMSNINECKNLSEKIKSEKFNNGEQKQIRERIRTMNETGEKFEEKLNDTEKKACKNELGNISQIRERLQKNNSNTIDPEKLEKELKMLEKEYRKMEWKLSDI